MRVASLLTIAILLLLENRAFCWNIPGHMITGAMAYRLLQAENPSAGGNVKAILDKHPWYAERWRSDLEAFPEAQRAEMLFMLAARWADDIRTKDRAHNRGAWHYINWPFRTSARDCTD